MSTTAQVETPVAEVKPAAKAPKQKKPKTASHPPYLKMIEEALVGLGEKSGSSPYAIAKYMEEKHKGVLPPNFRKILALQLKNSAAKGKLVKVKASYKLSEKNKKKKPEAPKKKVVAKKPKKSTPAKPKSIKTSAATAAAKKKKKAKKA